MNKLSGRIFGNGVIDESIGDGKPRTQGCSLLAIVVMYNCSFADSATCSSLLKQDCDPGINRIMLYDNSPQSCIANVPPDWIIRCDPTNGGLAPAYNAAAQEAEANGCKWLLLLDQDTILPPQFLSWVHGRMRAMDSSQSVAAILPIVMGHNRQLSPMCPKLGREVSFTARNVVTSQWLIAINSGTCVRVEFIKQIGGFSTAFWLDYLDFWLFKMIRTKSRSIYVGNLILEHSLSVSKMASMPVERYRNILAAELQFTNRYLPMAWRLVLVPRLAARAVKHFFFTSNKRIAAAMAKAAMIQIVQLCRLGRPA